MGYCSPNLVDHNGGPVKSSDVANNAIESNEVVHHESVGAKEVAQGAARRQLSMY